MSTLFLLSCFIFSKVVYANNSKHATEHGDPDLKNKFQEQVNELHATFNIPENDMEDNEEKQKVIIRTKNIKGSNFVGTMSAKVTSKLDDLHIMAMEVTPQQMKELESNPNVEVEVDHMLYAVEDVTQNLKKLRGLQAGEETPYGISKVLQDMDFWQNLGPPPGEIKVCVADTGYAEGHIDLPAGGDVSGTNNYVDLEWNSDGNGHGTHVAGTIAALKGNKEGVVGVIPSNMENKFKLEIGKALKDNGSGTSSGTIEAVKHCVDKGANIVSLSLAGKSFSQINHDIYLDFYKQGVLFIAAAGNSGDTSYSYPASYPSLMSVGAAKSDGSKAAFSQYNDQVEIAAPGVGIKSTIPGDRYATWAGTSMATPHVAGVAGLLWMYFPQCKNYQIRDALIRTAKDVNSETFRGCDEEIGHGLIQGKDAYNLLNSGFCDVDSGYKNPVGGCSQLICSSNSDCDDMDDTTIDKCVNGACENLLACSSDINCDDNDECTQTYCKNGKCFSEMACHLCSKPSMLTVDVTTDHYPTETFWVVRNSNNETVAMGGPYNAHSTLYSKSFCVMKGMYHFIINDDYGDGICCSYGSGSFSVSLDGEMLESGGNFADIAECNLEVTTTFAPTISQAPISSPTGNPVSKPTKKPNKNKKKAKAKNCKGAGKTCKRNKQCCSKKCQQKTCQ